MQASYNVRRSPLTLFIAFTILVGALVLGGLAGYSLRGAFTASALAPATQRAIQDSTAPAGEGLYVQGGRPAVVYGGVSITSGDPAGGNVAANIYVQGGRPPVVYATP